MKQVAKFVESIHEEKLDGRFHIYNLFSFRNSESEDAINYFEKLVSKHVVNIEHSLISEEELSRHPWILLGWGCKQLSKSHPLQTIKKKWMQRIQDSKLIHFGVQNAKKDYYHPAPRGDKEKIINKYVEQYRKIVPR